MSKKEIYTVYEIPKVKIGCIDDLSRRQKQQLSKGELIILESHTCIYKASERERNLQRSNDYKVDKHPYWFVKKVMQPKSNTPEAQKKRVANTDHKAKEAKIDRKVQQSHRQRAVTSISPEGVITKHTGFGAAARDLTEFTGMKFYPGGISSVCNPKKIAKTHRGYRFEYTHK